MSDKISFVVLAAGNSSRYGLLKQTELFGDKKLTIAEYNLLDAIENGVNNVVFVIKEQTADIFHKRLSYILPKDCTFSLVYQNQETDLCKFSNRTKPWGTGHAVLSTEHCIHENFGVINADDLYGRDAITKLVDFLKQADPGKNNFAAIGYKLADTLSDNGTVSRGIMYTNDGTLEKICEHKGIHLNSDQEIIDEHGETFPNNTLVSMNLWGFTKPVFLILKNEWDKFTKKITDPVNSEFYLPQAINNAIQNKQCTVKVIQTTSKWHGITYHGDNESINNWLNGKN